jgi:hypothetical protein
MRGRGLAFAIVCLLLFSAIVLVASPAVASVEATEEWVATYGYLRGSDRPRGIAVDSSGNAYVTGGTAGRSGDYLTVAYDSSGNTLWMDRYKEDDSEYPFAITIDASSNVYVTGFSGGPRRGDYATIKYDSSGNELWARTYDGPSNNDDWARAIAVDSSGNVYVTGESWVKEDDLDWATVAYDSSGNELWVARYDGPGNARDVAVGIAVGPSGRILVTGYSNGNGTGLDYTTIAYDSSGNELWVARYDGPGNARDEVRSMSLDSLGNVYITGQSMGIGTHNDYATVAYNSSGSELWVARYDGAAGGDVAFDIVATSSGNVHVTGHIGNATGTSCDCVTLAYDPFGNELWVARYYGPGDPSGSGCRGIAADPSGNVYVTGYSWGSGIIGSDYLTIAYDSSGNELWVMTHGGLVREEYTSTDIALDPSRNVYITGERWSRDTREDWVTIKYSQNWIPEPTEPTLDLDPDTLNLKSRGKWIAAYIELYDGREVSDIDVGTLLLNETIPAERWPTAIGDYDEDGIPDLMVKFNRSRVQEYIEGLNLSPGGAGIFGYFVTLTVTGSFNDGITFECRDRIRVVVVERMGVEPSPFSVAEYEGSMNRGLVVVQPQISFPLSSHSSEHQVMVVNDMDCCELPNRRTKHDVFMTRE